MGDVRFVAPYERLRDAADRTRTLRELSDSDVIAALAGASLQRDPYLANVLATEAQNRLRLKATILQVAGEGLGALDRNGDIVFMNPAGEKMLGFPPGALLGKNFHDHVHTHDRDGRPIARDACPANRSVFGDGLPWHGEEETFTRADGTRFPASYTATPVLRDGEVEGSVFMFQDTTERTRAQLELEASKERYRSLMQDHVDAIFSFDLDGRFLEANPALERMSGYTLDEMHRITFTPLVAQDERERTRERFQLAAQGSPQDYLTTLLCKDGTQKRVHVTNLPIYVQGRIVGVYGIAKDVTQRLRDEERLQQYADLLHALNEASLDAVVVVDTEKRLIYRNRRFAELWRFPPEVLVSESDEEALRWAASITEDPEAFLERVRRIYSERPDQVQDVLRLRDGRIIARYGAIVRGGNDRILGWVWTFRDITREHTERRRYEERLAESEARYRQLYDNVPSMYFLLDLEGRILSANRFGAQYLGYAPDDLAGLPVARLAHPDDRAEVEARLRAFIAGPEEILQAEFRKVAKSGEAIWVLETLRKMRDPSGRDVILNLCEDVTQRKRWARTVDKVWSAERAEETTRG